MREKMLPGSLGKRNMDSVVLPGRRRLIGRPRSNQPDHLRWRPRIFSAGAVGILTLVAFSSPSSAAVVLPHGPMGYTGGCNFQSPGVHVLGPFGNAFARAQPSLQNNTSHLWSKSGSDWQIAISPSGSAYVSQTLFWFVGPPKGAGVPGAPVGCLEPFHNRTGQNATYEWLLTYRAYVAANCSGHKVATASASIDLVGNVHLLVPPLYVFPVSPSLHIWSKTVHCTKFSTGTVHTGFLNLTTPPFNLTKRTTYDFYSGVSTTTSAIASGNSTAFAGVTLARAALVRVSCTC